MQVRWVGVGVPGIFIKESVEDIHVLRENPLLLMNDLRAVVLEETNFSPFELGWSQKNRLCSYSITSHMTSIYLASIACKPDKLRNLDGVVHLIESHENEDFPKYSVDTIKIKGSLSTRGGLRGIKECFKNASL